MHQLTAAMMMYGDDHMGYTPISRGENSEANYWWNALWFGGYITDQRVRDCKSNGLPISGWYQNYAMNEWCGYQQSFNFGAVRRPTYLILFGDSSSPFMRCDLDWEWWSGYHPAGKPFVPWGVHGGTADNKYQDGKATIGFCDGHVESMDPRWITCDHWPPSDYPGDLTTFDRMSLYWFWWGQK